MKTVSEIFSEKFHTYLENESVMNIAKTAGKWSAFAVLSVSLIDIPKTLEIARNAVFFHNFAIPKIIFSAFIVFGWSYIRKSYEFVADIVRDMLPEDSRPMFHGMAIEDIVNHIYEYDSFKRSDLEKYGVSRGDFDRMVEEMDSVKIFIRGANNSRVVNPQMTKELVYNLLVSNIDGKLSLRLPSSDSYFVRTEVPEVAM